MGRNFNLNFVIYRGPRRARQGQKWLCLFEIYAAIGQEPKLKLVGSGMPTLRTDVSTPTPA
jgi:hypothetical protein